MAKLQVVDVEGASLKHLPICCIGLSLNRRSGLSRRCHVSHGATSCGCYMGDCVRVAVSARDRTRGLITHRR